MGTSATLVALLVGLVAWSSLGSATPLPTSSSPSPVPTTTPSIADTTTKETKIPDAPEITDEQRQMPPEPIQEPEGEYNANPMQEGQVQISMQEEPFREYPPQSDDMMVMPGFQVPNNPDGQSDGTVYEVMARQPESEPDDKAIDPSTQQQEQDTFEEQIMVRYPTQRREPEEQPEDVQEQIMVRYPTQRREPEEQPEDVQEQIMVRNPTQRGEPEEQSDDYQEQVMVRYPTPSREPEEQSEDGQEEVSEPVQDPMSLLDFQKPRRMPEEGSYVMMQQVPDDSPVYNEVEGLYANQQERILPRDIPLVRIPMMEYQPMEE